MSSRRKSRKSKKSASVLNQFKPVILVAVVIIIFFILIFNIIFGGKKNDPDTSANANQGQNQGQNQNEGNTQDPSQGIYGPPVPENLQPPADNSEVPPPVQTVSVTIPPGSYASDVAKIMMEAKVIKDEKEFLNRIIALNKAGSIQTGTFEIPAGATEDDIINMISK